MNHEKPNRRKGRVLWITSEAMARSKHPGRFRYLALELVGCLGRPEVDHIPQWYEWDRAQIAGIVDQEKADSVIITPEPVLYGEMIGDAVVGVSISRVVNLVDWKTRGHKQHYPDVELNGKRRVFLDTVSFTGRTVEEAHMRYGIDMAIVEVLGMHALQKLQKLGIKCKYSTDASDFVGMWHLDDLAQRTRMGGRDAKPSEMLRETYADLASSSTPEGFGEALARHGIKKEQDSPNLFLELARPGSYLARSMYRDPGNVLDQIPLIEEMEMEYVGKWW